MSGTSIPLPWPVTYRSSSPHAALFNQALEECMSATVPLRVGPHLSYLPPLPAGADEPVPETPDGVAADPPVSDAEPGRPDGDGVEDGERLARLKRWGKVA